MTRAVSCTVLLTFLLCLLLFWKQQQTFLLVYVDLINVLGLSYESLISWHYEQLKTPLTHGLLNGSGDPEKDSGLTGGMFIGWPGNVLGFPTRSGWREGSGGLSAQTVAFAIQCQIKANTSKKHTTMSIMFFLPYCRLK